MSLEKLNPKQYAIAGGFSFFGGVYTSDIRVSKITIGPGEIRNVSTEVHDERIAETGGQLPAADIP